MATHKEPTNAEVAAEAAAIYPDTNPGPPTPEQIAVEAHAIYVARGGEHGHDMEDWLEAERQLTKAPKRRARKPAAPSPRRRSVQP